MRSAPPPPVRPVSPNYTKSPPPVPAVTVKTPVVTRSNTVAAKASFFNKPVQKQTSFKAPTIGNGIVTTNNISAAPALPPPNPGSHARPIISSPVLENSTCTAKELISPLRNAPKVPFRSAPEVPIKENQQRPLSSVDVVPQVVIEEKNKIGSGALNRIASFLKPADKKPVVNTNSLPRSQKSKVKSTIDKETLKTLEISNPIPQTHIEISISALPVSTAEASSTDNKATVTRAQSMRSPNQPKPNIQTFGSMRQPNGSKRPLSIPNNVRPKIPPPPLPPASVSNKISKEKPDDKPSQNQYDDCLNKAAPLANVNEINSPSSGDNIYAVIEDNSPPTSSPEKSQVTSSSGSTENMGLLGEIVSEIQNRNFDSIYSTSTLARKKKEEEKQKQQTLSPDSSETYVNTASIYKSPESEYSNMGNLKSSASSTSSGYIHPSAVNVPVKEEKPEIKSYTSPFSRQPGPLATTFKPTSPSTTKKTESDKNTNKSASVLNKTPPSPTNKTPKAANSNLSRQTTPPNLRTRKPSPTRTNSAVNRRSITNSPDLVTSCTANGSSKSPDVLSGGAAAKKPAIASTKPTVTKPQTNKTNPKSVSFKSPQSKTGEVKPPIAAKITKANSDASALKPTNVGLKNAAKQTSNVSSLQQKFEKNATASAKVTPKVKT